MAKSQNKSSNKKQTTTKSPGWFAKLWAAILSTPGRIKARVTNFLRRRPHRSFRRTRRRDYRRSLKLPGYWSFTFSVASTLREHKKVFLVLGVIYSIVSILLFGMASQENFTALREEINTASSSVLEGGISELSGTVTLALSTIFRGTSGTLSESQQVYASILPVLGWLVIVWLLRHLLAGKRVRVRDGLYNAGAPLIPMAVLALVLVLQLLPAALGFIAYTAATGAGIISGGGVAAMLIWIVIVLLGLMSLYWITATLLALVIVTVPGMYPYQALKIAGDMVVGRRIRILLRVVWLVLTLLVTWAIVMIPVILVDAALKRLVVGIEWVPIVPLVMTLLSVYTLIWFTTYVYLLYRRIVDDDAKPA